MQYQLYNGSVRRITKVNSFRVLLIEDERQSARMMMSVFGFMNLQSDHAVAYESAVDLAGKNFYDLAIVNINFEVNRGLPVIDILRQHQFNIEIITMTGHNPKALESRVRELGVLYHLVKPFSINELTSVLSHTVDRFSNNAMITT